MQILEEVIKFRWGALPDEQREGIRNYVSNLIIKLSSDEAAFRRERVFLNKLNIILVQARPHPALWAHLRLARRINKAQFWHWACRREELLAPRAHTSHALCESS